VDVAGIPFTVLQSPADNVAPTVSFTEPKIGARVTTPSIRALGTAFDAIGVARVEIQVGSGPFVKVPMPVGARNWTTTVGLEPGTNWLRVRSIDVAGNMSAIAQRPVFFASPVPLTLTINGSGKVVASPVANLQKLEIGRNYTLIATPNSGNVFSNWIGNGGVVLGTTNKLTFNMQPGTAITANFVPNPFPPVKGIYNGLFYATNDVQHSNAGFFKLTVTPGGTYSVSVRVGGIAYNASGKFDLNGLATNTVVRTNKTTRTGLPPLTILWNLGLNGEDAVNGSVTSAGWSEAAPLHGDRAVFNALTRRAPTTRYTVIIPPDTNLAGSSPQGYGSGTAVLSAGGIMTFAGTLADGTKVSQAVAVANTNAWQTYMWPLYVQLYANRGLLIGWVNTNSDFDDLTGTLRWIRPAATTPKYYTNGFSANVSLNGSVYRPPAAGTRIINLPAPPAANILLWDGELTEPSTNLVHIGLNNVVTNRGPNTLTTKFTTASGLFTGTFKQAGTTRLITFNGAVHQRNTNAAGSFLGTNVTGGVYIEPASP
jgi:hypothetical protein